MLVKKDKKHSIIVPVLIIFLVSYVALKIMTALDQNGGVLSLDLLNKASDDVLKFWLPLSITPKNIGISLAFGLFGWMVYETLRLQNKKNLQENTYGSADWQDSSILAERKEKNIMDNIILTETEQVSKNMRKSGMNRHILIVGRPGTGKSRYWFKPNLLNATGTIVCTDPKGELLRDCATSMVMRGYDIKVLNLDDMRSSNHYNPFLHIRTINEDIVDNKTGKITTVTKIREDDVMTLINCIMENTESDKIQNKTGDPFWEKSEMLFLQSLVYYMLEEYKDRPLKKNFTTILELIRDAKPDKDGKSKLDNLFDEFAKKHTENHIAVRQYRHFQVSAASPKTMSTIIMTATARLSCFNIDQLAELTNDDNMEIDRIGMPIDEKELGKLNEKYSSNNKNGKVAYFIITKPSNTTFNFIGTLMYTQMFQQIDDNAQKCGGSLSTPLDMYMDEFRQQGKIPNFMEMLAYVRGLNVGIVICLQSLSQLKVFYEKDWENILDCCDTILLIGSNSKETNEYFSNLLGKKTWYKKSLGRTFSKQGSSSQNWDVVGRELATVDELAKLEKGHCVMFIATLGAFYSKLYDLTKHPYYKYAYEPWNKEKTGQYEYFHNVNSDNDNEKSKKEKVIGLFSEMFGSIPNNYISKQMNNNNVFDDDLGVNDILVIEDFLQQP